MDLVRETDATLGQGEEYSWETEEKLRETEIREDMESLKTGLLTFQVYC